MTDAGGPLARRDDEPAVDDAASEAVLVEGATEDRLVDESEIAQAEGVRQDLETNRGVIELAADSLDGHAEDLGMVEGEGKWLAAVIRVA
jgi:hypothetical protein